MAEDVKERTSKSDAEVEERAAVTPNPHAPITPLTMPTTLQGLRNWLMAADCLGPAGTAVVSATGTTVSIA